MNDVIKKAIDEMKRTLNIFQSDPDITEICLNNLIEVLERPRGNFGRTHFGKWYERFIENSLSNYRPNDDGYFIISQDEYRHALDTAIRMGERHNVAPSNR
jgi:hypothetical protein